MAKLGDIFNLQMGKTPSRANKDYWNNGNNPWVSIADLSGYDKYVGKTKEQITNFAVQESGIKLVPPKTLLMSFKLSVGKTAITNTSVYTNEAIMAFIPTGKYDICIDYFFYLFSYKDWSIGSNRAVMGATLNKTTLNEIEIIVPPISEQRRIASILDKVSDLIAKRRAQLEKLDLLVKSRFVEMFGDPLRNTRHFPMMELTKICKAILGGGTPSKSHPEYFQGAIPWVSPKDMKQLILNDTIDHITEQAIANSTTKLIDRDSVLMVIRSGILKHTLPVAINKVPVAINQDMKAFLPNDNILSEFLLYYFKAIELDILGGVRGVTADNIDFKTFQKRVVIVPPLTQQKQFASFVQQTETTKSNIQKSLETLETLKKALMQEYFG